MQCIQSPNHSSPHDKEHSKAYLYTTTLPLMLLPYHTEALSPSLTSPITDALGATQAFEPRLGFIDSRFMIDRCRKTMMNQQRSVGQLWSYILAQTMHFPTFLFLRCPITSENLILQFHNLPDSKLDSTIHGLKGYL